MTRSRRPSRRRTTRITSMFRRQSSTSPPTRWRTSAREDRAQGKTAARATRGRPFFVPQNSLEFRLFLCRWRQQPVEAQIDRALAIVVRPVAHGHEHDVGARARLPAEEGELLRELRVVELRERFVTERERLLELLRQIGLAARARYLRARWRLHPADRAAEIVVPLHEVGDDVAVAHLRRGRLEGVLGLGHQLGGGLKMLRRGCRLVAECLWDGGILRRSKARKSGKSEGHRENADAHGSALVLGKPLVCARDATVSSDWLSAVRAPGEIGAMHRCGHGSMRHQRFLMSQGEARGVQLYDFDGPRGRALGTPCTPRSSLRKVVTIAAEESAPAGSHASVRLSIACASAPFPRDASSSPKRATISGNAALSMRVPVFSAASDARNSASGVVSVLAACSDASIERRRAYAGGTRPYFARTFASSAVVSVAASARSPFSSSIAARRCPEASV